ncbi:MAG TPA: DUF5362 family protein [Kiritimatiellia bacterium]|nr:DUF5362 family protein [Kiritimatiellia bacterium]HMP33490.1 DUF5362 family protein [Kiritimatiellia bacterium]
MDIKSVTGSLYRVKGWITFAGVLSIIQGAITAISIVGLLVAWLPIWMGVILLKTSKALADAHEHEDEAALNEALGRLALYFKILGILSLIGLVVAVLALIAGMLVPAFFAALQAAGS